MFAIRAYMPSVFKRLGAFSRPVAVALALLSGSEVVLAQSAVCRQIESELASIGRGGGGNPRAAAAARNRLSAVQSRMAAIGCDRGGFLFGPQPPAECSGLRAQAASYAAQVNAASQQANGGGARRAQLLAALDANNCRAPQRQRMDIAAAPQPQAQPQRPRGFFEMLFGGGNQPAPSYATETAPLPPQDMDKKKLDDEKKKVVGGGPLAVCVRTCDGFFFPVNYQGAGDGDQYEDVCRASCPNASTELYWMRAGADLDTAATEDGKAYTSLPTAFQYRQSYDPACTCKKQGETWGNTLKQAEALIRERRNDIIVSQERSDEMARPLPARELRGVRGKQAAARAAEAEASTAAAGMTGNTRAANSDAARILATDVGETREISGKDGEKKNVRVLVPVLSPDQAPRAP